jgi:hypothetical protein
MDFAVPLRSRITARRTNSSGGRRFSFPFIVFNPPFPGSLKEFKSLHYNRDPEGKNETQKKLKT